MDFAAYGGLFMAAFLAATLLPSSSEIVLVGLMATGDYPVLSLIAVASTGNILGAILNWWLGRGIEHFRNRKWFPVSGEKLEQAQGWYLKYGRWALLFSWVPLIGDALVIAAGILREKLWVLVILVGIAKTLRYVVVACVFYAVI